MSLENLPSTPAWRDEDRDFLSLTHSYFGAASILVERIFRYPWDRSAAAEMLFDPLMFLYRQAIECGLKYFLYSRPVNLPKDGHSLSVLYATLKTHINGIDFVVLKPLEETINWYEEYDTKSGEVYRYPFGKKGIPYAEKIRRINNIDVKSIHESIRGTQTAFLHIAYHLGGEHVAESFIFHDEFEDFKEYDAAEKKFDRDIRYE